MKTAYNPSLTEAERRLIQVILYELMNNRVDKAALGIKHINSSTVISLHEKLGRCTPTIKLTHPNDRIQNGIADLIDYVDANGPDFREYLASLGRKRKVRLTEALVFIRNLVKSPRYPEDEFDDSD